MKQLPVAIDFHIVEISGYQQMFGFQHSSEYLFVFNRRKKLGNTLF